MKSLTTIILLLTLQVSLIRAQSFKVTGTVSDTNGQLISGVSVAEKSGAAKAFTNINGYYEISLQDDEGTLLFSMIGFQSKEVKAKGRQEINVTLEWQAPIIEEVVMEDMDMEVEAADSRPMMKRGYTRKAEHSAMSYAVEAEPDYNTEEYASINENIFHGALKNPLSTFSIDVDAASYANMRRFLRNGQMPPKDAVRIEEMINYFNYDYEQPTTSDPFSINTEVSQAPWNKSHQLVHIGLQGRKIATENLPPSNLVFLIDVSGSMSNHNKLPLLKSAFRLLVEEMRPQDNVAIVVYAGAAGLVLPSTNGNDKETILAALDKLQAGGSTAGGAGINLAYKVAKDHFKKNGNNRIILATDGDFNVGASSNAEMERLIEEKRDQGIFLTVLGFGMGNYKDSKMEGIADKGNGNYAYIDNILEAKKVFVSEFGGTLFTIAKDVKIQIEFNPAKVKAYRLIGYENRMLRNEDFNNDKKDAGELGAGHTVTALYEIIPVGVDSEFDPVDDLKYQETKISNAAKSSDELMTVKLRYKQPDGDKSKLLSKVIQDKTIDIDASSNNFKWSAAVAGFGMILRDSEFKRNLTYADIETLASTAVGEDKEGYRAEFIGLVKSGMLLARK